MRTALQIVLWYCIYGCIAVFAFLRKSYVLERERGERTDILDCFRFDPVRWLGWLVQTGLGCIQLVAIWPTLLHRDQQPLLMEVEDDCDN